MAILTDIYHSLMVQWALSECRYKTAVGHVLKISGDQRLNLERAGGIMKDARQFPEAIKDPLSDHLLRSHVRASYDGQGERVECRSRVTQAQ